MAELAYMVREDWAQQGTAMRRQSAVIREWLGSSPYVFVVADRNKYEASRSADREFANYVAGDAGEHRVVDLSDLDEIQRNDGVVSHPLVVLHPFKEKDCDMLREVVEAESVTRLFVVVWAPGDMVRTWLDGLCAINLHTGSALESPDAVQLEAAKCWVDEQYNGLSGGNGKDAVVQLLRVFTAAGAPLDVDNWLRAFFAAGGEFNEAIKIEKVIKEMKRGIKHRSKARYGSDILSVLRERAAETE